MQIGKKSRIAFCDNLDGMRELPSDSLHLCFTSPPYWNYADYGDTDWIGQRTYDAYMNDLKDVYSEVLRVLVPGGKFVLNVTNMCSRKDVDGEISHLIPIAFDNVSVAQEVGFIFKDNIIWRKQGANVSVLGGKMLFGSYPYPPTPRFLSSMFEYLFVFAKHGNRPKVEKAIKEKSRLTKEEWIVFTRAIWEISTANEPDHPAAFPIDLAERVIRLFSFVGDTVLDPFAGSGTTIVAAEKLKRIGIGFELNESYEKAILGKINKYLQVLRF